MNHLHRRGNLVPQVKGPRTGLIFLDLNILQKNGWEALREVKSDSELRSIAVAMLAISETREDIRRIYELGKYSYITFDGLVNAMSVVGGYRYQIGNLQGSDDAA